MTLLLVTGAVVVAVVVGRCVVRACREVMALCDAYEVGQRRL